MVISSSPRNGTTRALLFIHAYGQKTLPLKVELRGRACVRWSTAILQWFTDQA